MGEVENLDKEATLGVADLNEIQSLYDLMIKEGLDSIELETAKQLIRLNRSSLHPQHPIAMPLPVSTPAGPLAPTLVSPPSGQPVLAPLAGVFYRASSPSGAPFVKEGDTVEPGQTLCIVEAMKVMNEIKAEKRGRIVKIVAENSRPISAGQPLFFIEPAE